MRALATVATLQFKRRSPELEAEAVQSRQTFGDGGRRGHRLAEPWDDDLKRQKNRWRRIGDVIDQHEPLVI